MEEALAVLSYIEQNTLSRQNIFTCNIKLPGIVGANSGADINRTMQYYIQGTSLPSSNLNLVEVAYLGKIKYAITSQRIDTINVTFYDTESLVIRNIFMSYFNTISDNSEHQVLEYYPSEFWSDLDFKIHTADFKAFNCTPINVGDFILDYNNTDSIGTFTVTFKTKYIQG